MDGGETPLLDVDSETTALLLSRWIEGGQPAHDWPGCDARLASQTGVRRLRARVEAALDKRGFSIVRLARAGTTCPHRMTVAGWNLFTCLAEPMRHSAYNELLYEVAVSRTSPPLHRYYSQSSIGGEIHTDGTYIHEEPPRYVALLCLKAARTGGESILIDGRRIHAALERESPAALAWLQGEYHFDCAGQRGAETSLRRRIIERVDAEVRVRYLRSYIVSGHRRAGEPLAPGAVESMDVLDALLQREAFRQVHALDAGDMLLLNNHTMLHGRTAFVDHADLDERRRLIRLWGRPHALAERESDA